MLAFVALIWDQTDRRACTTAQALVVHSGQRTEETSLRVNQRGFALLDLTRGSRGAEMLGNDSDCARTGIVLGPIFRLPANQNLRGPLADLSGDAWDKIFASRGKTLISDYWGSYIAFLNLQDTGHVITDPTSALPCYYILHQGVTVVFTHLEKLPFLEVLPLTINEPFIARLLVKDKIQTGETGLSEIYELTGGQRLTIKEGKASVEPLWDPSLIAHSRHDVPDDIAARELRDTASSVIGARASQFDKLTVSLSGGLDSAIVLACATKSGTEVNALHQFSDSGDPSEIHYAREVADALGCDLRCVEVRADRQLPDASSHPLSARPHRTFISPRFSDLLPEESSFLGKAVFTGEGGDHLLQHSRTALVFADHLRDHGLTGSTLTQLVASARLSEQSAWRVAMQALPHLRHAPAARRSALPPAKTAQIERLAHMLHVREVLDHSGARRLIHPLISQPFIELCLRIPTYQLCLAGVRRGLAREAFKGWIPESVRTRMSKGNATRYAIGLIGANRDRIGETLQYGELVRRGLLSPHTVEAFLDGDNFRFVELGRRMLVYYCIEGWLSRWTHHLKHRRVSL